MRRTWPLLALFACDPDDDGLRGPDDCASYWFDLDGDGFGGFDTEIHACTQPPLTLSIGGDCADDDPERHPGVDELCDRVDQDCDGQIDDDPTTPMFADLDGDGFGDPTAPVPNCDAWASSDGTDCDDADPQRHPGVPELCNGVDDDCDGAVDQDDPDVLPASWYADEDRDGVGTGASQALGCDPPGPDFAPIGGDCDDQDPTRFPGAPELCDGADNDCDALPEGPDAWVFAGLEVRVPVTVTAPSVGAPGPVILDVDFAGALASVGIVALFDPADLRAAVMDCGGPFGATELPVQFLDATADLTVAGADDDPVGDGHGAVVFAWDLDGDPATAEVLPPQTPVTVGLYFHGTASPSSWTTDLVAEDQRLVSGDLEATFSPIHGGLLSSLIFGISPSLARQDTAINGNGLLSGEGPLSAQDVPGTVAIHDAGPVTASVRAEGHVENDGGGFDFTYTYRMFTGRPELWLTPSFRATSTLTVEGNPDRTVTMRPFQSRTGLDGPTCSSDPGLRWADTSDAAYGLTWAWMAPPVYLTHLECAAVETWTAANDFRPCCFGTEGAIPSGTTWVDEPVLVLLPHAGGPEAVADLRDARLEGIGAVPGPAELR